MMSYVPDALMTRLEKLPPGLLEHCRRVSQKGRELALRFGASPEKAALAGLAHDIARSMSPQELLDSAAAFGIPVGEIENEVPILLHGPVGAHILHYELGIGDVEVITTVAWHSTGRKGMGLLEKVLFLADKMEEGKAEYYQGLTGLDDRLEAGLDEALLAYFDWQIANLLKKRRPIHPATVEARNEVLRALRAVPKGPF